MGCLCESICTWLQLSGEARRKQWMFWNWSYKYCEPQIWMLGHEVWNAFKKKQKQTVILTAHGASTGV